MANPRPKSNIWAWRTITPLNLSSLAKYFSDEDAARTFIERKRWPEVVTCPHCKSEGAYKLTPKTDESVDRSKRLSLDPLDFDQAVSDLLLIPPPPRKKQPQKAKPANKPKPATGRKSKR